MNHEQGTNIYTSEIVFFGQKTILACDLKCYKAWGIHERPRNQKSDDPDDYEWLADHELGLAPEMSPITEGDHNKPDQSNEGISHNKWCARECERSVLVKPGESVVLPDFNERISNISS